MEALDAAQAQAYVEELYRKAAQRWQERVREGEFMQRFAAGTLPREVLALFFKNWGAYTIEINTIVACAYHKYLHFFKQHPDLMAAMGEKIADEFMHPEPPGPARGARLGGTGAGRGGGARPTAGRAECAPTSRARPGPLRRSPLGGARPGHPVGE